MIEPILEARELSYSFEGRKPVLSNLSLAFKEAELVVLAGRNGAGKTVLAKCLAGIYLTRKPSVLFRGRDLASLKGSPATKVAYLFQEAHLQVLGDSLLEDALFGPLALGMQRDEAETRARAALESLGLGRRLGESPLGLSGGELRRLAIASVLALDPEVLILDEPFANLDWQGVASLLAVIGELRNRGKTLIVLTHELEKIVGAADRLIVMARGSPVADGKPGDLVGDGLEFHGLRNPLRQVGSVEELQWLDAPPA